MSKYALEAMSDAQRLELGESSGIRVCLMKLGNVQTPIFEKNKVRMKNSILLACPLLRSLVFHLFRSCHSSSPFHPFHFTLFTLSLSPFSPFVTLSLLSSLSPLSPLSPFSPFSPCHSPLSPLSLTLITLVILIPCHHFHHFHPFIISYFCVFTY
jgi:hypothetical protein